VLFYDTFDCVFSARATRTNINKCVGTREPCCRPWKAWVGVEGGFRLNSGCHYWSIQSLFSCPLCSASLHFSMHSDPQPINQRTHTQEAEKPITPACAILWASYVEMETYSPILNMFDGALTAEKRFPALSSRTLFFHKLIANTSVPLS